MSETDKMGSIPPPSLGRDKVGRYDVLFPLAQGGMASVYVGRLAGMAGFQRLVAIKVIHPHLASEKSFVKMFLDEARLAAGIHHPNVGEILEVGKDAGLFFMVGELVLGQSLLALFRRAMHMNELIPHQTSAWIASRVCLGLHAAHDLRSPGGEPLNLVHRDVSPRNILVSYDGFVKLIDFGVALAQGRMSHTDAGTLKGKIGFMPPEQIQGEPMDRRSDLFSLGVVLYRMITGSQPFPGKSDGERLHKILKGKFVLPRELTPEVDEELQQIILRAMATSPDDRYATAAEMAADLERYVRTSEEPTGTTALSELMRRLFEDELQQLQDKVRDFSEDNAVDDNSLPSIPPPPDLISTIPPGSRSEPPTEVDTPFATQTAETTAHRRRLPLVIGGALGLAVVLAVAWLISRTDGESPSESAPANPPPAESPTPVAEPPAADEPAPEPPAVDPGPELVDITLAIEPASAAVTLDGEPMAGDQRTLRLPADGASHLLTVSAPGFKSATERFVADSSRTITVQLKPAKRKKKKPSKGKDDFKLKGSPYG